MNVDMKSNNGLTWLIILLIFVIVYLLYNSDYSLDSVVDEVSDILDTGYDSVEEEEEEDSNIEMDEKAAYDPKSDEPYTVSVGNPKDITRCKKIPPVEQVEQIDFSYKTMYTPNSRGNVCNKGDIEDSALFPSLTNEKSLENADANGSIIMPAASFNGTEAPFVANCSFSKPSCSNSVTTLIPGELLIKESVEPGSTDGPKDTVEEFGNYYEGFTEGASCGGRAAVKDDEEPFTEGFIEGATAAAPTQSIDYYFTSWCGFSTKQTAVFIAKTTLTGTIMGNSLKVAVAVSVPLTMGTGTAARTFNLNLYQVDDGQAVPSTAKPNATQLSANVKKAQDAGVTAYPTLIFTKANNVSHTHSGYADATALSALVIKHLI